VVTLDSGNWSSGATVTVVVVDDKVHDGDQTCVVQTGAASSSGADYSDMAAEDVTVTVVDDDTAGIAVAPTSLTVSEPEGTDTFSITLSSEPADTVVVSVTTDGQTTVSPILLTFTDLDWNVQQSVAVTAVDDDVAEGQHSSAISQAASSSDENYDGIAIDNVTAKVTDNDTIGVVVTPTEVQVAEGGALQSYQVVLASQPTDTVTVSVTTDGQTTVNPTLLSFTELKWNVPQTVTVTAVNDDVTEGLHGSTISHISSSDDRSYLDVPISDVTARVTDNDAAGVVVTPTEKVTEGAPRKTEQVALTSQPTDTSAGTTEGRNKISPNLPIVIFVIALVVVACVVELVFGR
jgi:biopolymer transport protein ExbD